MSVAQQEPLPLVADATALGRDDWLPQATGWEKLDDLRKTHVRLLGVRAEAAAELGEIEWRHESEEKDRAKALQDAYREGSEPKLADPTPPEQKRAEIDAARERLDAANKALDGFLRDAEQTIIDHADEWLSQMDEKDAEAQVKLEEAKRIAAQALAEVQSRRKLRMWVNREAGRHMTFKDSPMRHFSFSQMADPPTDDNVIDPRLAEGAIHV